MNEPMTWGAYLTLGVLIPCAIAAFVGLIVFIAFARRAIEAKRRTDRAIHAVQRGEDDA